MLCALAAALLVGMKLLVPPGQDSAATSPQTPPGWSVYPPERVNLVTPDCISSSKKEWRVSVDGNGIKIVDYKAQEVEQPKLPPGFKLDPKWTRARRHLLKFDGGWLVGIDAGEWGGGLWITNEDGTQSRKIIMDNVRGIVTTSRGILVLSGLAHMSFDFGNVLMLSAPHNMQVSFEWEAQLLGAPDAFVRLADESLLVDVRHGIWKIAPSGEMENVSWLKSLRGYFARANSIAVTPDGTIYLGGRAIVVRLRPGQGEDWLIPDRCLSQNLCSCKP